MDEKEYLSKTLKILDEKINESRQHAKAMEQQLKEKMAEKAENYSEIVRGGDLPDAWQNIDRAEEREQLAQKELSRLLLQKKNPYFARLDYKKTGETNPQKIYIGIGTLTYDQKLYVTDWRAPISSLYYDYDLGQASFKVNNKVYTGEITRKRQYKIENGQLVSFFDTDTTINDDILKEILSKNASTKMKQIVSSIQKEQNQILRKDLDENILVQGIAGSGKTSIVLHRAAYLLYKHRDLIKSNDILILSPNNVFSSYISNVLPELGEDNLVETTFAHIVHSELKRPIESREEMLDKIASNPKQETLNEISYKSSYEYLDSLLRFLKGALIETYQPEDLVYVVGEDSDGNQEKVVFSAEETKQLFFKTFKGLDFYERINKIAWQYAMYFTTRRNYTKTQNRELKERFKQILFKFLPIRETEKVFEVFMAREHLEYKNKNTISYMDKGAYLLINHFLFGFSHDFSAKYLIIDEMQDFTPVDIYVFKKLWNCPCIVVGDIHQCIEKTLPEEYLSLTADFLGCKLITLNKTYRPTKEIALFSSSLIGEKNVEYVNRSGQPPKLYISQDQASLIASLIKKDCNEFEHIAIICKCNKEAKEVYNSLKDKISCSLMKDPEDYNNRINVTTCATAKGIEFDAVFIPNLSQENYNNNIDKNILYVSSTRALHKLFFTCDKPKSHFLKDVQEEHID